MLLTLRINHCRCAIGKQARAKNFNVPTALPTEKLRLANGLRKAAADGVVEIKRTVPWMLRQPFVAVLVLAIVIYVVMPRNVSARSSGGSGDFDSVGTPASNMGFKYSRSTKSPFRTKLSVMQSTLKREEFRESSRTDSYSIYNRGIISVALKHRGNEVLEILALSATSGLDTSSMDAAKMAIRIGLEARKACEELVAKLVSDDGLAAKVEAVNSESWDERERGRLDFRKSFTHGDVHVEYSYSYRGLNYFIQLSPSSVW
jgi:hypothetical protein